jgi:hypothetical protein
LEATVFVSSRKLKTHVSSIQYLTVAQISAAFVSIVACVLCYLRSADWRRESATSAVALIEAFFAMKSRSCETSCIVRINYRQVSRGNPCLACLHSR